MELNVEGCSLSALEQAAIAAVHYAPCFPGFKFLMMRLQHAVDALESSLPQAADEKLEVLGIHKDPCSGFLK